MLCKFRSVQAILCAIFLLICSSAFASSPRIGFSANRVQEMPAKHQSLLTGDVKISVGEKIKISGDKALVKYTNKKVTEFVIYGDGTLSNGKQMMQFKNANYYPQTGRITAEQMKRIE